MEVYSSINGIVQSASTTFDHSSRDRSFNNLPDGVPFEPQDTHSILDGLSRTQGINGETLKEVRETTVRLCPRNTYGLPPCSGHLTRGACATRFVVNWQNLSASSVVALRDRSMPILVDSPGNKTLCHEDGLPERRSLRPER